jgi:hypothetical protein
MPDDETVASVASPEPADAPEDCGAGSETAIASARPTEAPEQHQAEAETTSAASTEVVAPAAIDPSPEAAPVIAQDQWAQMARGVQETLARDLKLSQRLDELLSRPIFLTPQPPA